MILHDAISGKEQRPAQPSTARENLVCWTRMQTEAGQPLEAIIARKEIERRAGCGIFFWGVGNPPSRSVTALARLGQKIDLVFSVMKGRPRAADVRPASLLVWRRFVDTDGAVRPLPPHTLITSRGKETGIKRSHYALMCRSDQPLELGDHGAFYPDAYRNFGGTGAPVGSSQVTALLRPATAKHRYSEPAPYRINLRAELVGGLWIKLLDPVIIEGARRDSFEQELKCAQSKEWLNFIAEVRSEPGGDKLAQHGSQIELI